MLSPAKIKTQDVVSDDLEMARALFAAGDYIETVSITTAAIPRAHDDRERFALLVVEASALGELHQYQQAFETLESAGKIIEGASPMSKARFYCQRAYLLGKFQKTDQALIDYEAARFWAKQSGDRITEATARNNIAKQYSNAGRFEEAIIESDAAIRIGVELEDSWRLGRYYDQRAQILVDHKRFSESLQYAEKAIDLLADNPSIEEARQTYDQAVIGLFRRHTQRDDPIDTFRARRAALKQISQELDKDTARIALERSKGHVSNAADLLDITHPAMLKAIKRHGLQGLQQRKHSRKFYKNIIQ